ncbi:MAG: Gfo/Idh/MocA family oxidoreductase [Gemmatimonadaceae bacterium]|nr:Gfo/Idh/MocA family oxidoreductase [Gemmatimonadaceae bacterium]
MSPIRFALVGIGDIAERAVIPAFRHARRDVRLEALVSGHRARARRQVSRRDTPLVVRYQDYDALLESGAVDAVYIALPNQLHADFARRALQRGVHVLCEKPVTTTVADARHMREMAASTGARLMVAYRLYFDEATRRAITLARARATGELRIFASVFSSPVDAGDIRLERAGRGGLFDLGIYCVNAARMVFGSEPLEVQGMHLGGGGKFGQVPEMTAALLRYPGERLASFVCSLRAHRVNWWSALGTRRLLRMEPAFHYAEPLALHVQRDGRSRHTRYRMHDQFAAELRHFARTVVRTTGEDDTARDGEADIRILDAIDRAARTGRAVPVRAPEGAPGSAVLSSAPGQRSHASRSRPA